MTLSLVETTNPEPDGESPWRTIDPYHPDTNAENFDLAGYLAQFDPRLLVEPEGRRILTRLDPLLFALVYMRKHLRHRVTKEITFADPHFLWCREARSWIAPQSEPRTHRRAYVSSRESGKTTFWFLILPMWAAAHGHSLFAAAFANSGTQAETHLSTFKQEFSTNELLRTDFPDLCEPAVRRSGRTVKDAQDMFLTRSGFAFAARGIDSISLGLKIGENRPDLLLLDDIEPDESNYSADRAVKRLSTLQDAILPLNEFARVVLSGTVTMPGSLVHQLVRYANGEQPEQWIVDERFTVHHTHPIVIRDDGSERSIWPAKWSMDYLNSIRRTRSFAKNFANDPIGMDGGFWEAADFRYGPLEGVTLRLLSIDPTVTTKKRSDFAGLAIIGFAPARRDPSGVIDPMTGRPAVIPSKCVVEFAQDVKLVGAALRKHVLKVLMQHPGIKAVVIEVNQGGENWHSILWGLPCRLILITAGTAAKEVRAADALDHYQKGRVQHLTRLVRAEEQMVAFPKALHDDIVDAVVGPVIRLLSDKKGARVELTHQS